MGRNLKNNNHWIKELREIAKKSKIASFNIKTKQSMLLNDNVIDWFFDKKSFKAQFNMGLTPLQAFKEEVKYGKMDGFKWITKYNF